MFIDEITSVRSWQKPIKNHADLGTFIDMFILLTGSSAIEIKRGYERMPGRRGGGFDEAILPMDFFDFCHCLNVYNKERYELFKVISTEKNLTILE